LGFSLSDSESRGTKKRAAKLANLENLENLANLAGSYTAVSGESSSRAMSSDTSYSMTSGVGGQSRTNSIGSGMQLVQIQSSGNSIAETFDATAGSSSRATSSGTSRAMQMGTSSGSTRQGEDGNTMNMVVTTFANASSDGASQYTENKWAGDSRSTFITNSSTTSRSNENFTGTVSTDTENRTSRNGTAKSDANVTASGDFTQNNYVGGAFPTTEIVTGDWENKFDLSSNGEIDADHDRVKRMGEAKAKNDNKEKVTVDFTGGNGLTHDSETGLNTWNLVMTITDTRLTDDSEHSSKFNETEDISKDKETVNPGSENPVTVDNDDDSGKDGEETSGSKDPGKLTDRTKVTVDTWNSQWYDEAENNKDFKRSHEHTVTTDTTRGGENSTTATTKVEWTKDSKSRTTQANLDVTRSKSHEEGTHTKTFTTEGAEENDKQTLKITREVKGNSKDTTYHDLDSSYNIINKTIVVGEWDETSNYEATHKLAADGVSAKDGKLTADHTANNTKTTTVTGLGLTVQDDEVWVTTRFNYLATENVFKTNIEQNESFDYKDTLEGRILNGSGTSKETTTNTHHNSNYNNYYLDWHDSPIWFRDVSYDRTVDFLPNRGETVSENTQTVEIKNGKETVTNSHVSSGNEVWYEKEISQGGFGETRDKDYTFHIEERKDWKKGNLAEGEKAFEDHTLHFWGTSDVETTFYPVYVQYQDTGDYLPFLSGDITGYQWNVNEELHYYDQAEQHAKSWDFKWDINAPEPLKPPVQPYTGPPRGTGTIDTPDTYLEGGLWGGLYGMTEILNSSVKVTSLGYANLDETAKNLGDFAGLNETEQRLTRMAANVGVNAAAAAALPAVGPWAGGTTVGAAALATRPAQMAGAFLGNGYTLGAIATASGAAAGYQGYQSHQAYKDGRYLDSLEHGLGAIQYGFGAATAGQAARQQFTKPPAPSGTPAPVVTKTRDVPNPGCFVAGTLVVLGSTTGDDGQSYVEASLSVIAEFTAGQSIATIALVLAGGELMRMIHRKRIQKKLHQSKSGKNNLDLEDKHDNIRDRVFSDEDFLRRRLVLKT
jgi:hypothetical protein